jgi:hypothetical protein
MNQIFASDTVAFEAEAIVPRTDHGRRIGIGRWALAQLLRMLPERPKHFEAVSPALR